jgi:hypothetical protein
MEHRPVLNADPGLDDSAPARLGRRGRRLNGIIPGAQARQGKHAAVANVLAALDQSPVTHFACHWLIDGYDPRLTGNGAHPPRTHLSAVALHEAIRACRNQRPGRRSRWAPTPT